MKKVLKYKEAAELTRLTERALAIMVKEDSIPYMRYTKNRIRFDRDDLIKWMEDSKRGK